MNWGTVVAGGVGAAAAGYAAYKKKKADSDSGSDEGAAQRAAKRTGMAAKARSVATGTPDADAQPSTFKRGGKVKKTGRAKVHKGERVLTAKQSRKYGRRKRAGGKR